MTNSTGWAFLDEIGVPAMNMESLDGYFAALICGPDMVLPSEYLPGIWARISVSTAIIKPRTSWVSSCVTGARFRPRCFGR